MGPLASLGAAGGVCLYLARRKPPSSATCVAPISDSPTPVIDPAGPRVIEYARLTPRRALPLGEFIAVGIALTVAHLFVFFLVYRNTSGRLLPMLSFPMYQVLWLMDYHGWPPWYAYALNSMLWGFAPAFLLVMRSRTRRK